MPGALVVALVVLIYDVVLCLLLATAAVISRANAESSKILAEARLVEARLVENHSRAIELPRVTGLKPVD